MNETSASYSVLSHDLRQLQELFTTADSLTSQNTVVTATVWHNFYLFTFAYVVSMLRHLYLPRQTSNLPCAHYYARLEIFNCQYILSIFSVLHNLNQIYIYLLIYYISLFSQIYRHYSYFFVVYTYQRPPGSMCVSGTKCSLGNHLQNTTTKVKYN